LFDSLIRRFPIRGEYEEPSADQVKALLLRLFGAREGAVASGLTCVVHGDLHAGNVFSLLDETRQLQGVALIDWGKVHSDRHPLSDIAKLMVDLHYHVRWNDRATTAERDWAFEQVKKWGSELACDPDDWMLALLHNMAKMLFYRDGSHDDSPTYLPQKAREAVWADMEDLTAVWLRQACSRTEMFDARS
jgi:hypothetical protein